MSSSKTPIGLKVERYRVPEGLLLRLEGAVDERFPAGMLAEVAGVIAVNLAKVRRVTSYGIREWRREIHAAAASEIYFVNVPANVVAQFAMVADFGGPRGQLVSFLVPFRCERCGAEQERLLDRRSDSAASSFSKVAAVPCACGGEQEFDDVPEFYQGAIANTATLRVVPALFAVLGAAEAATRPLKLQKLVVGDATVLRLSGALDARASFRHVADGVEGQVAVCLADVTACDDAGLAALRKLLAAIVEAGCEVHVTECPPGVLDALAAHPEALGGAPLVSLAVDVRCPACRRASRVVDATSASGAPGLSCPTCGADCQPEGAAALIKRLARVPIGRQPAWMPALVEGMARGTPLGASGMLIDRYQLIRPIGAGGMAEIFLARQAGPAGFERPVAVKRILPSFAADDEFVRMFLAEARLAARLSHPNIVRIHELIAREGQYYIVMEYVEGANLAQLLATTRRTGKPMPVSVALRLVSGVLAGLVAAHEARGDDGASLGIVHRDVTPGNILVGLDGAVRLSDFGVAKAAGAVDPTRPGTIKGKIAYQAPEALLGQPVDLRADLFSVGIVLFECLNGAHPFRRGTDYQTYQAVLADQRPRLKRDDLPPEAEDVVACALAREREQRYPSAASMQAEVDRLARALGTPATDANVAVWMREVRPTALEAAAAEEAQTGANQTVPGTIHHLK